MITCKRMPNGFEYLHISSGDADVKVALQGAHVFEYTTQYETPIIWMSECAVFEHGTAIRGGIPICWPWFGMDGGADKPQHGFARTAMWELLSQDESDHSVTLQLKSSEQTRTLWSHDFILRYHVRLSDHLELALESTNCSEAPLRITQALHSYFHVNAIEDVTIEGLDARPYFDAMTASQQKQRGVITFSSETDRVYEQVSWPLQLHDAQRTVRVDAKHSSSCIIWNPWIEKCARMSHMCDNSYQSMVCIETANARGDAREIAPGESITLETTIKALATQ